MKNNFSFKKNVGRWRRKPVGGKLRRKVLKFKKKNKNSINKFMFLFFFISGLITFTQIAFKIFDKLAISDYLSNNKNRE